MNKVKFISAIYSNLYGTEYGGRPGRNHHYKLSLLSLLKMTAANFVVYTSDEEVVGLEKFFFQENNISRNQLELKVFDLKNSWYGEEIKSKKDLEKMKKSDRCYEVQYNKFLWLKNEIDEEYEFTYWIDAGLSHAGIIPNQYLTDTKSFSRYFESPLFNNKLLTNLLKITRENIYVIGKDNTNGNYWSRTVPAKYYNKYDNSIHIIGGLFGGKINKVVKYLELVEKYFLMILEEPELYYEELLMSLIYHNHKELFYMDYFQIWIHKNSGTYPQDHQHYIDNKSFYEILVQLNN